MAVGDHFLINIYKQICASDLNNVRTDCWPTTTLGHAILVVYLKKTYGIMVVGYAISLCLKLHLWLGAFIKKIWHLMITC